MSSLKDLRTFVSYKAWADERLYLSLVSVPVSELVAERRTRLGSILATLNHLYAMDLVWQAHLKGRPHGFSTRRPDLFGDLSELHAAQTTIDRWYVDYVTELSSDVIDTVMDFEFIGGGKGAMSRGEILLHVVNHATYHRGHATDAMLQIPARPPVTDLPVYLREMEATHA